MPSKLIVRLAYENIFGDKPKISTLLNKVNRNESLIILTLLNKYEYKLRSDSQSEVRFILNEWLSKANPNLKKKILSAFLKHAEKQNKGRAISANFSTVTIINRISTLRLMELLLSKKINRKSNKFISKQDNEVTLFKLYLLVAEEISSRQDVIFRQYLKKNQSFYDDIHLHLFLGLTHPFLRSDIASSIQPEVYKFLLFEKWLRTRPEYYRMSKEYLENIGLKSWYEYFTDVFNLSRGSTENIIISARSNPVLKVLLSHFRVSEEINPSWSEFTHLKKNPLVELENENYLILDFEFLLDKLFSSLYHEILSFSKKNGFNKFSQDYNTQFIEDNLLKNTFKAVFGKSYIKLSESNIKQFKFKGIDSLSLPDFYIRNGRKVFLFECKNSFISNANKIHLKTDELLDEIKSKFYYASISNSSKRKSKAILQLLNFFKLSIAGKYNFFDKIKNPERLVYYPILLVTDPTLTSLGFNQLMNSYMDTEIDKANLQRKDKLKPITIIHIDDFLFHQTRLKKLSKIIDKYHKYLERKNGFDRMISFSDYLKSELFLEPQAISKRNVEHIIKGSLLPSE